MNIDSLHTVQPESDPFGLRKFDFIHRVPEHSEMFNREEALQYIRGCDYPESVDDLLLVWETQKLFGPERIKNMSILDAMCGPGRLGREFSQVGAKFVVEHDGDMTMLDHARSMANSNMNFVQSPVENIPLPDNSFDLVICHNSTHQLSSLERLDEAMREFLRLTKQGGHVIIADYQRGTSEEFMKAMEQRLRWTKPEIVPLLIPTFLAAFSKEEFAGVVEKMPRIKRWSVTDAQEPILTPEMQKRVDNDPVKGHLMDFSPISLRVIVQKE